MTPTPLARNKYSHGTQMGSSALRGLGIDSQFLDKAAALIGAAGAYNSWKVYRSALNKIKAAEAKYSVNLNFPWGTIELINFVLCCASDDLRASTVRNYISQIKKSHTLSSFPWVPDNTLANAIIKGLENTTDPGRRRVAVTPRMLLLFKEKLIEKKKEWVRHDRRALWALICCLWAGSFRSSELLSPTTTGFITEETFTWGRMRDCAGLVDGAVTRWISVKLLKPKEFRAGREGVNVELFQVEAVWDPVEAMDQYRKDNIHREMSDMPVFRWAGGENITNKFLNSFIRNCSISMAEYPPNSFLASHSFRAGIVSIMGAMGCEESLIKTVGRWAGNSWVQYAKSGRSIRKSDQLYIQSRAAKDFADWSPVPVLVEEKETEE